MLLHCHYTITIIIDIDFKLRHFLVSFYLIFLFDDFRKMFIAFYYRILCVIGGNKTVIRLMRLKCSKNR